MALCHDERDFAMGFSREDPHASRQPTDSELKRKEDRKHYLDSLTPHQKRAYERVQFCLAAVGQYMVAKGEMVPIQPADLHRLFPSFARLMGYKGKLYRSRTGRCKAVTLSFPQKKGSIWFITPYDSYYRLAETKREEVHTLEAREAGLEFCKGWLPDWNWNEVVLP